MLPIILQKCPPQASRLNKQFKNKCCIFSVACHPLTFGCASCGHKPPRWNARIYETSIATRNHTSRSRADFPSELDPDMKPHRVFKTIQIKEGQYALIIEQTEHVTFKEDSQRKTWEAQASILLFRKEMRAPATPIELLSGPTESKKIPKSNQRI